MKPSTSARHFHSKQGHAEGQVNGVMAPASRRMK